MERAQPLEGTLEPPDHRFPDLANVELLAMHVSSENEPGTILWLSILNFRRHYAPW